jgi:tetratricopeptide (TPR) repeat protein
MTPERWQQVKAALAAALEQPNEIERAAFVTKACADDTALRREVQSLLEQPDDELDAAAEVIGIAHAHPIHAASIGRKIGSYELVRELGRGGMGTVWLARRADQQFEKLVAIKLLKRGTDTEEVLRRFYAERQILARLDHPNIARLLDAGETEDLPYFVMEYVNGAWLTDFVQTENLSLGERLRLFIKICSAVQFAHQNLVVHRDLKPANLLVTADCEPKLLDFGVAKLLAHGEDAFQNTIAGQERFTPAYASPEQVRGEPITTISDVYSLGALLYEILTGTTPHRFSTRTPTASQLHRVICEEEPLRPSAAARDPEAGKRLRGDLDTILLHALAKDPQRRYRGAAQLGDELRRYLENRPVRARPDTVFYRTGKFLRRNKVGTAAAALVALTLIAGVVMTELQARQTKRQFQQTRRLAHAVLFDYHDAIARLPGSTAVRKKLVSDSLSYLDGLAKEGVRDRSLQLEIALAYLKIGDVQGEPYTPNLGDTAGALVSYRKANAILAALVKAAPRDDDVQRDFSLASLKLAQLQMRRGAWDEALEIQRKGTAAVERLVGSGNSTAENRALLADSYLALGKALYQGGHSPSVSAQREALVRFEKSLAIRQELAAADPSNREFKRKTAVGLSFMGYALWAIGDLTGDRSNYDIALTNFQKCYETARDIAAAEPTDTEAQRSLGTALSNLADKKALLGDPMAGRDHLLEALPILRKIAEADLDNLEAQRDVAEIELGLTRINQQLGELSDATAHCAVAVQILDRVQSLDPASAETAALVAAAHQRKQALEQLTR